MRLFCCLCERTEPKAVHRGDRPRAHREDVAQNSADAGRRALEWFDEGRMIVRFDLECDGQTVADIDDAGVFARTLEDGRSFCRQTAQMDARALVAAVLAPHDAENAEFRQLGLAFEDADDLLVFGFGESVLRKSSSVIVISRRTPVHSPSIRKSACRPRFPGSIRSIDPGAASCRARCAARSRFPRCCSAIRSDLLPE